MFKLLVILFIEKLRILCKILLWGKSSIPSFSNFFLELTTFSFGKEDWALDYNSMEF